MASSKLNERVLTQKVELIRVNRIGNWQKNLISEEPRYPPYLSEKQSIRSPLEDKKIIKHWLYTRLAFTLHTRTLVTNLCMRMSHCSFKALLAGSADYLHIIALSAAGFSCYVWPGMTMNL